MKKNLKLGLFGFGCVGQGLYHVLHETHGVKAEIKKILAEHLEEIYNLQLKYGKPVLYEGAVCGSIPILRNLEEYYDNDLISSIEGIFNGSTNYILTKVFEENRSYGEALAKAQELGFAESDPSLDV